MTSATALIASVAAMRMKERYISAATCRPVASPKLLAKSDAMVLAGAKIDALIWLLLPTSMASAIVSPIARPSASTAAPTMPVSAIGSEICQITSQRVAPSASAPSLMLPGVACSAERDSAAMVGRIMIANTKEAGKKPGP